MSVEKTVCIFIPFEQLDHADNLATLEKSGTTVVMPAEEPNLLIARVICTLKVARHFRDSLLSQGAAARASGDDNKADSADCFL